MPHSAVRRGVRRLAKQVYLGTVLRGSARHCACCGSSFRRFRPAGAPGRPDARCPRCGSMERHRLLWRWLDRNPVGSADSVLHVAPEAAIAGKLAAGERYVRFDLEAPDVDVHGDLTRPPFAAGSFDLIVCSHVLEHVPDDRAAMRALGSLLSARGVAVILVPIDEDRAATYEDPSAVTPARRLELFGQEDHVRIYGRDLFERLDAEGLAFDRVRPTDVARAADVETERLDAPEVLLVCRAR